MKKYAGEIRHASACYVNEVLYSTPIMSCGTVLCLIEQSIHLTRLIVYANIHWQIITVISLQE